MTEQPLLTVRPGPVLHIWREGQEVARVPLELHGALTLAADLLAATVRAQAGGAPVNFRHAKAGTGACPFVATKPAPIEKTGESTP